MRKWIVIIAGGCLTIGCSQPALNASTGRPGSNTPTPRYPNTISASRIPTSGAARKIVQGARAQLHDPAHYAGAYYSIAYPGGDVPLDKGACVDVVIRSLRAAGFDLQKLIHEDMKRNFSVYPRRGTRADPNIDHRRVPNQRRFFARFGKSLALDRDWKPGDIVSWKLDSGLDHTGVLSDEANANGLPLVIHNLSQTAEEDVLYSWKVTGHYRFPPPPPLSRR
jgi:uncharacterized protein